MPAKYRAMTAQSRMGIEVTRGSYANARPSVADRLLRDLPIPARRDAHQPDERASHEVRTGEPRGRGHLLEAPVRALELAARRLHARLEDVLRGRPSDLAREDALEVPH